MFPVQWTRKLKWGWSGTHCASWIPSTRNQHRKSRHIINRPPAFPPKLSKGCFTPCPPAPPRLFVFVCTLSIHCGWERLQGQSIITHPPPGPSPHAPRDFWSLNSGIGWFVWFHTDAGYLQKHPLWDLDSKGFGVHENGRCHHVDKQPKRKRNVTVLLQNSVV